MIVLLPRFCTVVRFGGFQAGSVCTSNPNCAFSVESMRAAVVVAAFTLMVAQIAMDLETAFTACEDGYEVFSRVCRAPVG